MQKDILILGHLNLDTVVSYPSKETFFDVPGGNALGASIGAALWNDNVMIASKTGYDFPQAVLDTLSKYGINTQYVERVNSTSLRFWVFQNNDSSFFSFDTNDFEEMEPDINQILIDRHFSGAHIPPIPFDQQYELTKTLRLHNILIALDTLPIEFLIIRNNISLIKKILSNVDIFMPTWREIQPFFKKEDISVEEALVTLSDLGPTVVVIRKGVEGSVAYSKKYQEFLYIPSFPAKVIETTGAGDAFCGGFIGNYTNTEDILESALRGTVSASFMVEQIGVLRGLGKQKEAEIRLKTLRHLVKNKQ